MRLFFFRHKVRYMPAQKITAPKIIADPIYGVFDVRQVLPMIETPEFQSLGDKRQLGMNYLVFPSATHSRKAHSLGAYYATRVLADRWIQSKLITAEEGDALSGYALYHDIGHPAFSHVTEALCDKDNDELGLEIVKRLRKEIEACGINYELLLGMAEHKNPLYLAVHDKNLGMEKLDYLERDGFYTILSRPPGADYLRKHIYFVDGNLAIDEKAVDSAIETQDFYMKMYKNVYLRKAAVIAQRMLQKMVYKLMEAGEISKDDIVRLTDSELLGILALSGEKTAKEMYGYLRTRNLYREAIVIRPEKFTHAGNIAGKNLVVFGIGEKEMAAMMENKNLDPRNQEALENLEKKIAEAAGLPETSVLVVPVTHPGRFEAKDILILSQNGGLESLKGRYPAHFKNIEEVAQSYFALRVCTLEEHRKKLSDRAVAGNVRAILAGS